MEDDGDKYGVNRRRKPSERRDKKKKKQNKSCDCFGGDVADLVDIEILKNNSVTPEKDAVVCKVQIAVIQLCSRLQLYRLSHSKKIQSLRCLIFVISTKHECVIVSATTSFYLHIFA